MHKNNKKNFVVSYTSFLFWCDGFKNNKLFRTYCCLNILNGLHFLDLERLSDFAY